MPQYEKTANDKIKYFASILCLLILLTIISTAVVFSAISPTLAAEVTMEVYQQKGHKIFGQETSLDIFDNPKLGGQSLVAPFTVGTYTFGVFNNSNSETLPYTIAVKGTNLDNIPLVFSVQKNGTYIYGGANDEDMRPLSELNLSEMMLNGKKTDLYTIKWRWNTVSDEIDTAIGNEAVNRDLIYKLEIIVTGTIYETDPSGTTTSGTTTSGTTTSETTTSETTTSETTTSGTTTSGTITSEATTSETSTSETTTSGTNTDTSGADKIETGEPGSNLDSNSHSDSHEETAPEFTLVKEGDMWLVIDENGVALGYVDFPYESWEEMLENLIPLGNINTVSKEDNPTNTPKTNDNFNIFMRLMIMSAFTLILLIFKRKKN